MSGINPVQARGTLIKLVMLLNLVYFLCYIANWNVNLGHCVAVTLMATLLYIFMASLENRINPYIHGSIVGKKIDKIAGRF